MKTEQFNKIIEEQLNRCKEILCKKAGEYAVNDDRLHNFRIAAWLEGLTMQKALAGMMAKHTISIYDMCWSDTGYSNELWEEKITDHINYLLLLKASLQDEGLMVAFKEDNQ